MSIHTFDVIASSVAVIALVVLAARFVAAVREENRRSKGSRKEED